MIILILLNMWWLISNTYTSKYCARLRDDDDITFLNDKIFLESKIGFDWKFFLRGWNKLINAHRCAYLFFFSSFFRNKCHRVVFLSCCKEMVRYSLLTTSRKKPKEKTPRHINYLPDWKNWRLIRISLDFVYFSSNICVAVVRVCLVYLFLNASVFRPWNHFYIKKIYLR